MWATRTQLRLKSMQMREEWYSILFELKYLMNVSAFDLPESEGGRWAVFQHEFHRRSPTSGDIHPLSIH